MLTLIVRPQKLSGLSSDGKLLTAFGVSVKNLEGVLDLHDCSSFSDLDDIGIVIQLNMFSLSLNLPEHLRKAIASFLRFQHVKQDMKFDCYAFVNEVCAVPQHEKLYLLKFWQLKSWGLWPQAGDVVFFTTESKALFHHAAVYIGFGLYVSVYGAGGDLEISTLKDLRKGVGGENIFLATPRP